VLELDTVRVTVAARSALRRWGAPLAVLAGGLLGAGTRAAVAAAFPVPPGSFPVTTFAVNLTGSVLLGGYLARRQRAVVGRWSLQFWAIGALGSFTTFSTFSVEVVRLMDTGAVGTALWYAIASTIGGLAAALAGDRIGKVVR
jgi:CrcB protein